MKYIMPGLPLNTFIIWSPLRLHIPPWEAFYIAGHPHIRDGSIWMADHWHFVRCSYDSSNVCFWKRIFNDKFYAFCSAFLMMFDFMHFSQTRIATIDSYVTLFVILMYYYMYDYFIENSHLTDFKGSLKPLFLCGLFFGLGAASKWIAFYGAIGLALLFCINKISGYAKYKKHAKDSPIQNYYHNLVLSLGAGVLFFAVIPSITYILSYIPWIQASGGKKGLGLFWENSLYMLKFHSGLVSTHGYQSSWWNGP